MGDAKWGTLSRILFQNNPWFYGGEGKVGSHGWAEMTVVIRK